MQGEPALAADLQLLAADVQVLLAPQPPILAAVVAVSMALL